MTSSAAAVVAWASGRMSGRCVGQYVQSISRVGARLGFAGRRVRRRVGFSVERAEFAHGDFRVHGVLDIRDRVLPDPGLLETLQGLAAEPSHGVGGPPVRGECFEGFAARGEVCLRALEVNIGVISQTAVHNGKRKADGVRDEGDRRDVRVSTISDEVLNAIRGGDAAGIRGGGGTAGAAG